MTQERGSLTRKNGMGGMAGWWTPIDSVTRRLVVARSAAQEVAQETRGGLLLAAILSPEYISSGFKVIDVRTSLSRDPGPGGSGVPG
jgi:hypothetical protein